MVEPGAETPEGDTFMARQLLMGNEAIALAALHAGVGVACGYPGTPSTEILETFARHNPGDAYVEWSINEKAAVELAVGASWAGARVLVTMKQVGLNVAADPLLSFTYVGCTGGVVLVVADDPGPISSQTEQDTRQFAQFAHVPVFDPATPEEAYAMVGPAFELSEKYRTPVILRPTTRIDHGCAVLDVPPVEPGTRRPASGFVKDPRHVIFPARSRAAHEALPAKLDAIAAEPAASGFNPLTTFVGGREAEPDAAASVTLGVVTSGDNDGYVREAAGLLRRLCADAGRALPPFRLLRVGTPFPFPETRALEFAAGLDRIVCFEELEPVLEREFWMLAGRHRLPLTVHGKLDRTTSVAGENSIEIVAGQLAEFLDVADVHAPYAARLAERLASVPALPGRPPTLCPGCPHRGGFAAVTRAVAGRKVVYSGDIGCYTLGFAEPLNATDTCLCMGAGLTMAQGLGVVEPDVTQIAFIGDSTFFASGMTGVANAVYNRHRVMIVVLDNGTTAMTGTQPDAGTGRTLMGEQAPPLSIRGVLAALGVGTIVEADPLDAVGARAAVRTCLDADGVSALIFRRACVQIVPSGIPVEVDADACSPDCRQCVEVTGCPALAIDDDVAHVDAALCNGCGLCVAACPFDAIAEIARPAGGVR